jgi:hypothetical protein
MLNWTLRKYQSAKYITVSSAGFLARKPAGLELMRAGRRKGTRG